MSPLIVNGIPYIRSHEAAAKVGLVADYISRMCRDGDVDGKLIDGVWYVNEQSLAKFIARKDEEKRQRSALQAQHLKDQRRKADAFTRRTARRHAIPRSALATITLLVATSATAFSSAAFASQLSILDAVAEISEQLPDASAAFDKLVQLPSTLSAKISGPHINVAASN